MFGFLYSLIISILLDNKHGRQQFVNKIWFKNFTFHFGRSIVPGDFRNWLSSISFANQLDMGSLVKWPQRCGIPQGLAVVTQDSYGFRFNCKSKHESMCCKMWMPQAWKLSKEIISNVTQMKADGFEKFVCLGRKMRIFEIGCWPQMKVCYI